LLSWRRKNKGFTAEDAENTKGKNIKNILNKTHLLLVSLLGVVGLLACSAPHTRISSLENQGMIRLVVEPDSAHVYIDGQDKGRVEVYEDEDTPLILPAGLHKLQIKEDGYKPFQREVYLGGGSVHEIKITLEKE